MKTPDAALAAQHLAKTHPRFAALIARAKPFAPQASVLVRPFDALAESIAYQQLSGKAAATIWGRVRALYPRRKWLDPKQVLATPDENTGLRSLRRQDESLEGSRRQDHRWHCPPGSRTRPDERRGNHRAPDGRAGHWALAVEMLLLFDMGRLDVWPVTDLGVQKGYAKTFGKRKLPTPKEFQRIGEKWRPIASWPRGISGARLMPESRARIAVEL